MSRSRQTSRPRSRSGASKDGRQGLPGALLTLLGAIVGAVATVIAALIVSGSDDPSPIAPPDDGCAAGVEVGQRIGPELVRAGGEPCAFSRALQPVMARCPSGWVCEWERRDATEVVVGGPERGPELVYSGTWRFVDAYPSDDDIHDVCQFATKVRQATSKLVVVVGAECQAG
jgi:hypothetical protein